MGGKEKKKIEKEKFPIRNSPEKWGGERKRTAQVMTQEERRGMA